MLDFDYSILTKVFFGRDKLKSLGAEVKKYNDRILLVYGEGSIKEIGLYKKVIEQLEKSNIFYKELSGVRPNPRISSVREGIKLCRDNELKFILAVGGGSVIDCTKAIAAGFYYDGDPWDFFSKETGIGKVLPIGTILTLSATGSEMNGFTVISNEETKDKLAAGSDELRPKFSFLDPTNTFTVSKKQTAAGIVDIYSHVLEQYFCLTKGTFIQDRFSESILATCIENGPKALKEPKNYDARANLMWASSLALNGLLTYGKIGDWSTHYIEHQVSAVYDLTHGVGLAILAPYWMEHVLDDKNLPKFVEYAKMVWGVDGKTNSLKTAKEGIKKTRDFFNSLGMPQTLSEVGVQEIELPFMAKKITHFGPIGTFKSLDEKDVLKILKAAF